MTASPDSHLEETSVFADSKHRLLKSAVIYGANAGGKSNLLKAVAFMRRFVFESSKESQAAEDIKIENFRLSTESEDQPSFFNSVHTNPCHSQLIFATHDIKLLDRRIFRRDQIWFAEKDDYEATDLFSLAEYRESEDKDISFENSYMSGEYGAVPFIGDTEFLLGDDDE